MNLENHPCFNDKKRHLFGRVHLPVATKCNIQCNYCVRKFDCINESKPGVTSGILTPLESIAYLNKVIEKNPNISVAGIAGPGDPFANPVETMKTLRLVRGNYPEMMLCVATNGLNIEPFIDELSRLNVSHITITINAIDPAIGAGIYSWVRYDKKVFHKTEAAELLISRQLEAIKLLKEKNILVKINAIIIPGVNENHITDVAQKVKELGADIINCIPMINNKGSVFENIKEPDKSVVVNIRSKIFNILPQISHCSRCRADAVGLINNEMKEEDFELLKSVSNEKFNREGRNFIAVGSREGLLINQHLGEISNVYIYENKNNKPELIEVRTAPTPGKGEIRWHEFAYIIKDCSAILVSGAGDNPEKIFSEHGIKIIKTEGFINDVILRILQVKKSLKKQMKDAARD